MRFGSLVFAFGFAFVAAAYGQTDARLQQALPEIAKQASKFWQSAPGFIARETLKQKAIAPQRKKLRIGEAALQPQMPGLKDREIVSYYGFSSLTAAPEAPHEVRQIVSIDGKQVEEPSVARERLKRIVESRDDRRKQVLLRNFEKANLSSAAIDFGQLILLFTRSKLDQYAFEMRNTGMAGADQALVISFRQNGGEASLHIVEAGKQMRGQLQGELWVRLGDYAVLRITLAEKRLDGKIEIRDEARVDYVPNSATAIVPASVTYRRFLNDQLYVQNIYQYSDWQVAERK